MSDISFPTPGRAGLPSFVFIANEGPPSVTERLAAGLVRLRSARASARPADPAPDAGPTPDALPAESAETGIPLATRLLRKWMALVFAAAPARRRAASALSWLWRGLRLLAKLTYPILSWAVRLTWRIIRRKPLHSTCVIAGSVLLFTAAVVTRSEAVTEFAPRESEWIPITRPAQVYSLESPDLSPQSRSYDAFRARSGIGRRDILSFGTFEGTEGPWMRLEVHRIGNVINDLDDVPTSVRVVRRAAEAGLTWVRNDREGITDTRFGPVEMVETALARHEGAEERICLAFGLASDQPAWQVDGLACEAPGRLVNAEAVLCMLDRLDLQAFGEDLELASFFTQAENGRRRECGRTGAARSPLAPPSPTSLLKSRPDPKVKATRKIKAVATM